MRMPSRENHNLLDWGRCCFGRLVRKFQRGMKYKKQARGTEARGASIIARKAEQAIDQGTRAEMTMTVFSR